LKVFPANGEGDEAGVVEKALLPCPVAVLWVMPLLVAGKARKVGFDAEGVVPAALGSANGFWEKLNTFFCGSVACEVMLDVGTTPKARDKEEDG